MILFEAVILNIGIQVKVFGRTEYGRKSEYLLIAAGAKDSFGIKWLDRVLRNASCYLEIAPEHPGFGFASVDAVIKSAFIQVGAFEYYFKKRFVIPWRRG
ncbi:MAG: hypothetical protein UX91_C0015G0021 [Candidatus Amesbacteria bacterium GW2011_GWB1_47_19]|nr:MAG: hypothetical protein UX91_C0015G0021 [Candidatus Amesbacteria bacterium GW2011_GWB1_47_19]